jgi:hypothetical protein
MGPWRGFWNLPGFTWRVKAKVDFGGNAVADVSGEKPADIVWTSDGGRRKDRTRRREGAKKRKKEVFREFASPRCAVAQDVFLQ